MWKFVKTGTDGNCDLFGVNVFDYKWKDTGKEAEVLDPLYNQAYVFDVYTIDLGNQEIVFAAGEFSNTVYGFFIPDP
jgi:hypothetical protein